MMMYVVCGWSLVCVLCCLVSVVITLYLEFLGLAGVQTSCSSSAETDSKRLMSKFAVCPKQTSFFGFSADTLHAKCHDKDGQNYIVSTVTSRSTTGKCRLKCVHFSG
jgi:hypothetical protein